MNARTRSMQCARGLHQYKAAPCACPEGFLLPFESPAPELSPSFQQKLHKRGHTGSPQGRRLPGPEYHAGMFSTGRAGRKTRCLSHCLRAAQFLPRYRSSFRNGLVFMKKRKHPNDGNQELPKLHFPLFYVTVSVVTLQWSVGVVCSSPGRLTGLRSCGGILHRAVKSEQ